MHIMYFTERPYRYVSNDEVIKTGFFGIENKHFDSVKGGKLLNGGQPLTPPQTRRASNYGLTVDRMRHIFVALCLQTQQVPDPAAYAA